LAQCLRPYRVMPQNKNDPFMLDVKAIRERARKNLDQGAVTAGYRLDVDTVVKLLNDSLATELVCYLRYKRHYFMGAAVGGIAGFAVVGELLEHAKEEEAHADRFAERIVQLGGEPDFNPEGLATRSHAEYVEGKDLPEMLREDLVAERIAIDTYREIITFIGDRDATTRRIFEDTLTQEEEHADDLSDFLRRLSAFGVNDAAKRVT
jgi:bacterioferritin